MILELHQLELRYEKLRRRNAGKERQLVASLAEKGQQLPVVVVAVTDPAGGYVLVDGYKRVRALAKLQRDTVCATVWQLAEVDAVLLERLMRTAESDGALEQGWLLEELNERFGLSGDELARRFDKSPSWVSRRLALVRDVPQQVQEQVQRGSLPAHAAMKYLVPLARAKRADCIRLVAALTTLQPSTRDVEALYTTWVSGNKATRELVVAQPAVVLKAREQARNDKTPEASPGRQLLNDFGILVGVSRRAYTKLACGLFADLLPTEAREAKRVATQARRECQALFEAASELFGRVAEPMEAEGPRRSIEQPELQEAHHD